MDIKEFGTRELIEYFTFLDDLRDSNRINMFGGAAPLRQEYDFLSRSESSTILCSWMESFDDNSPADRVKKVLGE